MDVTPQPMTHNPMSWFYATSRPKNDVVKQDQEAAQNYGSLQWQTGQPLPSMEGALTFATNFPAMNYSGSGGGQGGSTAVGGQDVDLLSRLLLGDEGTFRVKGHQQLFARPYATTPNMGGGPSASAKDTESKLIQSQVIRQPKEFGTVTDKTFPWVWTPMIPELRSEMSDVNTYVEQWTRGGEPSRLVVKNRVLN
jgi:hypothetical protein